MTVTERQTAAPGSNLASSIGKNTLFGVVANVVQIGTRLVTVPIVIHHLGLGGYGIWNIITMVGTYMRFGSVGIKTAYQKYVAEATGNGDYDTANKLLSTGCAMMLGLSIAVLCPVAYYSTAIVRFAGVPPEFLESASGAVFLLAIIMGIANVGAAFESTVTGGHRIDLVRKFTTVLTVAEAIAIVVAMSWGFGLLAMATIMGVSELLYICACFFAARRVVPQIQIAARHVSKDVLYELIRFAGSYQLVNLFEVIYFSLVPFAILKNFGANMSGVYAVATRVTTSAGLLQEAFLPPLLSGGAMVYASGSAERMQNLIAKAFKVTLLFSLFPLGFIAMFGSTMAYAWTGEANPYFLGTFWLVSARALFQSVSLLALVLYRTSGNALLDNIRQVLKIGSILLIAVFAPALGFYGVLAGMALAEFAGMVFMFFALTRTFRLFRVKSLVPDTVRLASAAALMITGGLIASLIPLPYESSGQSMAAVRLIEIVIVCMAVAYPSFRYTGSITPSEASAAFNGLLPARFFAFRQNRIAKV